MHFFSSFPISSAYKKNAFAAALSAWTADRRSVCFPFHRLPLLPRFESARLATIWWLHLYATAPGHALCGRALQPSNGHPRARFTLAFFVCWFGFRCVLVRLLSPLSYLSIHLPDWWLCWVLQVNWQPSKWKVGTSFGAVWMDRGLFLRGW